MKPSGLVMVVAEELGRAGEEGMVSIECLLGTVASAAIGSGFPKYNSDEGIDSNSDMSMRKRSSSVGVDGNELKSNESYDERSWASWCESWSFSGVALEISDKSQVNAAAPCSEYSAVLLTTSQKAESNSGDGVRGGGNG